MCCGLATTIGLGPQLASAKSRNIPFCGFSIAGGWTDKGGAEYITHRANPNDESGIPQVIARIKESLAIEVDFDVYIAKDEDNAFATVAGGRKIVVVDVDFLEELNRVTGTEWSAIQVIAHEVGHHIAGFMEDKHRGELSADYWSGQCLQRLGSSKDAAKACILRVGTRSRFAEPPEQAKAGRDYRARME